MNISTLLIALGIAIAFIAALRSALTKKSNCGGCSSSGCCNGGCHCQEGDVAHAINPFKIKVSVDSSRASKK